MEVYNSYYPSKPDFSKITKVGERSRFTSPVFHSHWKLGRFCNYTCSYCLPNSHSSFRDHISTDVYIGGISSMVEQARNNGYNRFYYTMSGGEPTLHPGYLDILSHINSTHVSDRSVRHTTITNLSHGKRFWQKYIDATSNITYPTVIASWHREMALISKDYDKHRLNFVDRCQFLQKNGVSVLINIVMDPEVFDELLEDAKYFSERGVVSLLKPLLAQDVSFDSAKYSDEQRLLMDKGVKTRPSIMNANLNINKKNSPSDELELKIAQFKSEGNPAPASFEMRLDDYTGESYFTNHAEVLLMEGKTNFSGWRCSAGMNYIHVDKGIVYRGVVCSDEPLGSLQEGFTLFETPVICITRNCTCATDLCQIKELEHESS